MKHKRFIGGLAVTVIAVSIVVAVASAPGAEAGDVESAATADPSAVVAGDVAPRILLDGSVDNPAGLPGVEASGPAPAYLQSAALKGNGGAQVALYMWEHGAKVVPMGDGKYAIPMPNRIPPGIAWPTVDYPAYETKTDGLAQGTPVPPPTFLDPAELALWDQTVVSGKAFSVERGEDGYVHIKIKKGAGK